MSDLKLYGANICPFVHRVRLSLAEKDLSHEYVKLDLASKPDWYYDVLPTGKVPLLEHAGSRIWESAVICEYLEETFPQRALLPSAPAARAQARIWVDWAGSTLVPPFYALLKGQDASLWEGQKRDLTSVLERLDTELQDKAWLLGDEFSLADLEIYPWFERWPVLEHYRDFALPTRFENLHRWCQALARRPAVSSIVEAPEFYIQGYSAYAEPGKR